MGFAWDFGFGLHGIYRVWVAWDLGFGLLYGFWVWGESGLAFWILGALAEEFVAGIRRNSMVFQAIKVTSRAIGTDNCDSADPAGFQRHFGAVKRP